MIIINMLLFSRIFETEEGKRALKRKDDLAEKIRNVELEILQNSFTQIESDIQFNMSKHLLIRNDEDFLVMDFDATVSKISCIQNMYIIRVNYKGNIF